LTFWAKFDIIATQINQKKDINLTKNLLIKFELECGRQGTIESCFITTEKELEHLIDKNMEFYEVLGKHSYIEHKSTREDFVIVSEDQDKISVMAQMLGCHISGIELEEYIR
jgi:hypothetical protein